MHGTMNVKVIVFLYQLTVPLPPYNFICFRYVFRRNCSSFSNNHLTYSPDDNNFIPPYSSVIHYDYYSLPHK